MIELLGKLPRERFGKNIRKADVLNFSENPQKNFFSTEAIQAVQSASYNCTES